MLASIRWDFVWWKTSDITLNVTRTPIILITISAFSIFHKSSQLILFEYFNLKTLKSVHLTAKLIITFFPISTLRKEKMSRLQRHARSLFCVHHVKYHSRVFWWQKKYSEIFLKWLIPSTKWEKNTSILSYVSSYRVNLFNGLRSK